MSTACKFNSHRRCQRSLFRPPTKEAGRYSSCGYARNFTPLGDRAEYAVEAENTGRSPIIGLLLWSRPTAVTGFVVAVVVDAIKRMLRRRSKTHVGEEVLELQPPLSDLNAATAVAMVGLARYVSASLKHLRPCHMLGAATASVGSWHGGLSFSMKAAAACCVPCRKIRLPYLACCAALASTLPRPHQLPAWLTNRSNFFDHRQAAKHTIRQVC